MLTSPAKTLNWDTSYPANLALTEPQFLQKTKAIHSVLQQQSARELTETLHVSDTLAQLNYDRFQSWTPKHTAANSRPSLFTFRGDIFKQMPIETYDKAQIDYAQRSLRVLSGFYGILRPLDLMQPYRLEMGTNLNSVGPLHTYWKEAVTTSLHNEISANGYNFVLNLASVEYANAVDFNSLPCPTITVHFKHERKGQIKTIALLAKQARGMMIHHCITVGAETIDDIKKFSASGYELTEQADDSLTFLLPEAK